MKYEVCTTCGYNMVGDFPFPPGPEMHLNPFGPKSETLSRAKRRLDIINNSALKTVCG